MLKDIIGFEGLYQADTDGKIWSLNYNNTGKRKEIKPVLDSRGRYYNVRLNKNNKQTSFTLHRILAISFIPNPDNKEQVNHINGIKTDNRIENLEWVSQSENMVHACKHNLRFTKLKEEDIYRIFELRAQGLSHQAIADIFGVSRRTIGRVLNRERWKHIEIKKP